MELNGVYYTPIIYLLKEYKMELNGVNIIHQLYIN